MKKIIDVRNVRKTFKKDATQDLLVLDQINLSVKAGEIVALLGTSGSGKSTLLRIISGLISPSSGSVSLMGSPVTGPVSGVGMVFQHFALMPWMTVLENVEIGLEAQGVPIKARRKRALQAIDLVGMDGFESAYPRELSGGMRQRVGIARALVIEPKVLLLDEPLSALDPFLRVKMRYELRALQQKLGITFIHVTHSQDEALALSDIIVVMNDGKIEQIDKPAEIFNRPKNEFVAKFVGNHNIIQLSGKKFAVRMDKTMFEIAKTKSSKTAIVSAIEFQGEKTKVSAVYQDQSEIQCLIGDSQFSDEKFKIGSFIRADWAKKHLVPLHG